MSLGLVGAAHAAPANTNGSFENGTNPGPFTTLAAGNDTGIDNWRVVSGTVDYIGSYWQASDGNRSLDMSGNEPGAVSQDMATVVGHTYEVAFDIAANPEGGSTTKTLMVGAGGTPQTYDFDRTGRTPSNMGWTTRTFEFTATDPTTTLTFTSLSEGAWGPALDNVVVTDVLTDMEQCKKGGWNAYTDPTFENQGDCVSHLQSDRLSYELTR